MIYIDNTTKQININKHLKHTQDANILILVNNFTQNKYLYQIDNKVSQNEYFYFIDANGLDFSGLKDGEYTFSFGTDTETYEEGLLNYSKKVVDEMIC